MEYVYTAMLLHSAKQPVNEANVKKVLEAAGVKPEEGRVKALVGALDGVDIDAAIKEAAVVQVAAAPVTGPAAKKEEKKEEKKNDEEAAAGLAGLFG
ncbi:50S ribosomal protein P1 [Candidatus Woesearchaeota archaeon]|nr:MAG: large subunit ribosomal protein L12 [archaeon GW2011_AR18]MBS3161518.1 50S ribosomal protein P1 [Candidatus Woesearchaeota archaeon]HIH25300.1 50S ribosomal protein P1 [Nanoarchaeota archaeon]